MDAKTFAKLRKAQTQSGLSIRKFCRSRRFAYHTFLYWSKKLPAKPLPPSSISSPSFVELVPAAAPCASGDVLCIFGSARIHLPTPLTTAQWRDFLLAAKEVFAC